MQIAATDPAIAPASIMEKIDSAIFTSTVILNLSQHS